MTTPGLSSEEARTAAMAYPDASDTRRLRAGSLRFFRTIAESGGVQGPTGGVVIAPAILVGISGGGTALVELVAAVAMGFVAYAFVIFTRGFNSAGSVYGFTGAVAGPMFGFVSEPARRSARALAAAQASVLAGGLDAAAELLNIAMAGPLDELQQARTALLRGQIAFASTAGSDAPALLVKAAKQLEPLDAALARQTYLDAWLATVIAGRFAGAGDLHELSRAARSGPPPLGVPRPSDLLLDALAVLVTEGRG